ALQVLAAVATAPAAAQGVGEGASEDIGAERRARELFYAYYFNPVNPVLPIEPRPDPGPRRPEACVATSLADCFGGDPDCRAVGFEGTEFQASAAFRVCTAETVPLARARLLATLDSLGAVAPASDLIVGQRVSFALKSGETG